MTRNFRNFLFFCFGLFLGGVSTYAAAETVPATSTNSAWRYHWGGYETPSALCTSFAAINGVTQDFGGYDSESQIWCKYANGPNVGSRSGTYTRGRVCDPPGTLANGGSWCVGYTCPTGQNWTLSGSYCTRPDCAAGEVRQSDGTCLVPCPAGETKNSAGVCSGTCYSLVVSPSGSCLKATTCIPGMEPGVAPNQAICADQKPDDRCPSGGIVIGTFNGKPMCISPPPKDSTCDSLGGTVVGTINGQPICSQANNPTCPGGGASIGSVNGQPVCNSSCPSGQASGTVNGVTSCYPVSPTTNKTTTQKSTSQTTSNTTTSTDPGTPNSSSTSTSTTACEGTRCTTTTILNTGSGTVTSTKEEDKGDYCSKYPKASVCTGETEAEKFCEDNPDAISCMKAGSVPEEGALPSQANSISSINVVSVASNATCPADIPLPKGMKFEWGPICSWAEALRPIVLALAWLAAGLIVLGVNF